MWVPLGLVIIVAVAYLAMQNGQAPVATNNNTPGTNESTANQNTQPGISAVVDIDAAVNAVIAHGAADQAATKDEEANAATAADTSAMSDVGTAFTNNDY